MYTRERRENNRKTSTPLGVKISGGQRALWWWRWEEWPWDGYTVRRGIVFVSNEALSSPLCINLSESLVFLSLVNHANRG